MTHCPLSPFSPSHTGQFKYNWPVIFHWMPAHAPLDHHQVGCVGTLPHPLLDIHNFSVLAHWPVAGGSEFFLLTVFWKPLVVVFLSLSSIKNNNNGFGFGFGL